MKRAWYVRCGLLLSLILSVAACSDAEPTFETLGLSVASLTAVLRNHPAGASPIVALDILVGGPDVTQYSYKIGNASLDCTNAAAYSAFASAATPITDDITAMPEGPIKLCVIGSDGAEHQPYSSATSITWTKAIRPDVTVTKQAAQSSRTTSLPIRYDVVFTEPIDPTSFSVSDISNAGNTTVTWTLSTSDSQTYELLATAVAPNGDVIPSIHPGVVRDLAGNLNLSSTATNTTVNYDNIAPTINSVTTTTSNGAYSSGTTIPIRLVFSEAVDVIGAPTIEVQTGGANTVVSYTSGSGTNTLTFNYTVGANDYNLDLELSNAVVMFAGGESIRDLAGNNTNPSVPVSGANALSTGKNIKIVGTPAQLSISDGPTYTFSSIPSLSYQEKTFTITAAAASVSANTFVVNSLGAQFTVTGNTCTVSGTLAPLATCEVTVRFRPLVPGSHTTTLQFQYNNGITTNALAMRDLSGTGVTPFSLTVNPYYSNAPNWNDYIRSANTNLFTQGNTVCDGTELGYQGRSNGCIHGGELKKVSVPGFKTCTDLVIEELLGALEWECDDSTGSIEFRSQGLKAGKGLRDLVSASAWHTNSVTVKQGTVTVGTSTATNWWGNTVTPLPDNSSTGAVSTLASAGTIYVLATDRATFGYNIAADKISVVTRDTVKLIRDLTHSGDNCDNTGLTGTPNQNALLCMGSRKFIWLEALLDGGASNVDASNSGIYAFNTVISRIHDTRVVNMATGSVQSAVHFKNSGRNYISGLDIYAVACGFQFSGASYTNIVRNLKVSGASNINSLCGSLIVASGAAANQFHDVRIANHNATAGSPAVNISGTYNVLSKINISNVKGSGVGVLLNLSATNNIISEAVVSASQDAAIVINSGDFNILSHITAVNNTNGGVILKGASTLYNFFNSLAISNSAIGIGSGAAYTAPTPGNTFYNIAASNYDTAAVDLDDSDTSFYGYLIAGSTPVCGSHGSHMANDCEHDSVPAISINIASAFTGKVGANDATNAADTNGGGLFSAILNYLHWWNFANFYRSWGVDGSAFPNDDNRGYCGSGSCRIYDLRVLLNSALHNRSIDGQTPNGGLATFATGGACLLSSMTGNDVITPTSSGKTFMKNAIEINDDEIGNEDGLCESGEDCIYAQNIGAYQGEGDYKTGGWCTTSGTVTGAKIYKYPTTSSN